MEQSPLLPSSDFEERYVAHRASVYSTALRIVGNASEAEDVTQQVFLKFWSDRSAFQGGNFAAWITRTARNAAIDLVRRRRTVLLASIPANARSLSSSTPDVEDEVVENMVCDRLRHAFASLKPTEHALVSAAFFGEQSHEQIAASSKLPLGTVKSRIRAGLRRMRPSVVGL